VAEINIPEAFDFLFEPSRYKAAHGGRGSAKSHSFASALVLRGVQRPTRWLFCREIQKSLATSVHQLLRDKIDDHGLGAAYRVTKDGIRGPNGTHFLFAGLRTNPDSIKSMEGLDGAWVEEADRVSQASLDLLLPTVRKEGSEIWFSWNRRNESDPVDQLFLGGTPPPGSIVRQVNWRDNPFFPSVLREEMYWMKERDRDKWAHVWEGEPLRLSEARVFKNWREDDLDDQVPEDCVARWGSDWGFSIDPTVLVKMYRWGRTLYIAREAWKIGCEIDDIPSLFAGSDSHVPPRWENKRKHKGVEGVMSGQIVADSARPETISYLRHRGFNIKGAIKGARSIEEGIEFINSHDVVVHPDCKHVVNELDLYSYKVDKQTDEILPELEDKDNHTIDSIRYGLEGDRRSKKRKKIHGGSVVDGSGKRR